MHRTLWTGVLFSLLLPACAPTPDGQNETQNNTTMDQAATETFVFIGTYTRKEGHVDGQGEGIYVAEMDRVTGELTPVSINGDLVNPSYLHVPPNHKFAYAVSEIGPDVDTAGSVLAFAIDPDALVLEPLNHQTSHGHAPCYVTTDSQGRFVFAVNYLGGAVVMLPVREDGTLGPAREIIKLEGKGPHGRQDSSHPHSIVLSPDERYAYVPDLGTDRIMIYEIDYPEGLLRPAPVPYVEVPPASGPRHFAFHSTSKFAYVINELSNTIDAFLYEPESAKLTPIQTISTLPDTFEGENTTADIHLSTNGRFLYGSNRGHNSIVIYRIDQDSGQLTLVGHESTQGEVPRNFAIYRDFLYVANQDSDNIVGFKLDGETGLLTQVTELEIPTPVCLQFVEM